MVAYVGTSVPSAFYVGSQPCTAMYVGTTQVYGQSTTYPTNGQTGTGTPTTFTTVDSDTFTGSNGANASTSKYQTLTGSTSTGTAVNIQSNALRINPGSKAWAGGVGVYYVGTPIVPDAEYTFDMTLTSITAQQYHIIGLRVTNNQVYASGNGAGSPKTGYCIGLSIQEKQIQIWQGYNAGNVTLDTANVVWPSTTMSWRVQIQGQAIRFRFWTTGQAEPTGSWIYDNETIAFDQSDGQIAFEASNGSAATARYLQIDNLNVNVLNRTLGADQSAPTTNPAGFKNLWVENFNTTAAAASAVGGSSPFASTYANSWQPYASGTGNEYYSEVACSAHDGVMDVNLDGTHGAAGTFGPSNVAFGRNGGKFSVRAKAFGGIGNGAAFMLWPQTEVWDDGEIDYPESNFEVSPFVHQHIMNGSGNDQAENETVQTGTSWRDWHVYSVEWVPGTSLKYYLDDVLIGSSTTQVPTVPHRHMFQVGNYGGAGHLYIDWVAYWEIAS